MQTLELPPVDSETQVQSQLSRQASVLDSMNSCIENLECVLASVIRQPEPSTPKAEGAISSLVSLADTLNTHNSRLDDMVEYLMAITKRVEL